MSAIRSTRQYNFLAAITLVVGTAVMACILLIGPGLAGGIFASQLGDAGSQASQEALFTLLLYVPMLVVALIGSWWCDVKVMEGTRFVAASVFGLAVGLSGITLSVAYTVMAGSAVRADGAMQIFSPLLLVGGLAFIFIQVLAEEWYFRGWIQPVLERALGPVLAIGITSVAFAALHFVSGTGGPMSFFNLILGGMWFGLLRCRSGGIESAVAAHWAWNASEQLLFGLDPNPGVGGFGAIVDLDLLGSSLWGGSQEGLNASLAMTIALTVVIVPLLAHGRVSLRGRAERRAS